MEYEITFDEKPAAEEIAVLGQGLHTYGEAIFGPTWSRSIAYFLREPGGKIAGGVYGHYGSFNWLYIDTLWVSEEVRGSGHGSRLIDLIETEAARNSCTNVYLDTFSFQAPEFYKKLGYEVFGKLDDFPPGHSRIFMTKSLSPVDIH